MALTNMQYEAIIREYNAIQDYERQALNDRQAIVQEKLPEYRELEAQTASLSVSYLKRLMNNEPGAREALHNELETLSAKKSALLERYGFPADYLQIHYHCPDCKDTGFIGAQKCHCFREREISRLYDQSRIRDVLEAENFDTLTYDYYPADALSHYEKTVQLCKDFAENFDRNPGRSLLFTGTVGTGKTFLSHCIAKSLIDSAHSVIYFSSVDFFDTLSKNVFDKSKDGLYSFYDDLYNCDLVIVDDLGTELTNSFVGSYFFSFLNERQIRRKSTIISTNLSLNEISERYSERTCSRIVSIFEPIVLKGQDLRIQKRSRN
ncbi:MAG: ATP-binding protein [Lachnospiraceae bacterium]|nr:ATP-binding protein [Lachnospiraceae bacterium]